MEQEENYRLYSAVEQKAVEWLWYPYIPYGKITLLQGDPGDGKSTFMINIAACVSKGGTLPDGAELASAHNVIYQCAEDNPNDTVKPRLEAAGAACSRIAFVDEAGGSLTLSDNRIEDVVQKFGARLLILDPLQAFIPQDGDMQSAARMRAIMGQLAQVAEKNRCAVVLIGHMTKAGGKNLYRGLGSIDIAAIARSVLMIARDEKHPEIRYMFPVKSSLSPEGSAVGFLFDEKAGFQWIGKCRMPGNEMPQACYVHRTKKERAEELLGIMLSAEDIPSATIIERLGKVGTGERTVRTVQKEMGIHAYKKNGKWYWRLPEKEAESET